MLLLLLLDGCGIRGVLSSLVGGHRRVLSLSLLRLLLSGRSGDGSGPRRRRFSFFLHHGGSDIENGIDDSGNRGNFCAKFGFDTV